MIELGALLESTRALQLHNNLVHIRSNSKSILEGMVPTNVCKVLFSNAHLVGSVGRPHVRASL